MSLRKASVGKRLRDEDDGALMALQALSGTPRLAISPQIRCIRQSRYADAIDTGAQLSPSVASKFACFEVGLRVSCTDRSSNDWPLPLR